MSLEYFNANYGDKRELLATNSFSASDFNGANRNERNDFQHLTLIRRLFIAKSILWDKTTHFNNSYLEEFSRRCNKGAREEVSEQIKALPTATNEELEIFLKRSRMILSNLKTHRSVICESGILAQLALDDRNETIHKYTIEILERHISRLSAHLDKTEFKEGRLDYPPSWEDIDRFAKYFAQYPEMILEKLEGMNYLERKDRYCTNSETEKLLKLFYVYQKMDKLELLTEALNQKSTNYCYSDKKERTIFDCHFKFNALNNIEFNNALKQLFQNGLKCDYEELRKDANDSGVGGWSDRSARLCILIKAMMHEKGHKAFGHVESFFGSPTPSVKEIDSEKHISKYFIVHCEDKDFDDWWNSSKSNLDLKEVKGLTEHALKYALPARAAQMLIDVPEARENSLLEECVSQLVAFGEIEMLMKLDPDYLRPSEVDLSPRDLDVVNAYKKLSLPDRTQSEEHKRFYGAERAQEIYKQAFRECVLYVFDEIKRIDHADDQLSYSLANALINNLAMRRRNIALKCNSQPVLSFGERRNSVLNTSTVAYPNYHKITPGKVEIELPSKRTHILTIIHEGASPDLVNRGLPSYLPLWEHCKPPADSELNNEIIDELHRRMIQAIRVPREENREIYLENVKNAIAEFNWLFSNVVPLMRGSAAVGEMLASALWLKHGFLPPTPIKGRSPDCDALSEPNIEAYKANYIKGAPLSEA